MACNQLFFSLKNKYNGEINPFFLTNDQIRIIKMFPWGFIDHDNLAIKHIAWRAIRKNVISNKMLSMRSWKKIKI
jgi:hypothetical protein